MTPKSNASNGGSSTAVVETTNASNPERERVFSAYRQWGYLEGDLDPLGFLRPRYTPELEREGEYAREARAIYSSTIGVEINHIYSPVRRRWIYDRMESADFEVAENDQARILDLLIRADIFEQVMQQRYLGSKRFSLEGVTALLPLVDEILDSGSRLGATELVMGMSHRGRLNVIAHVARRPPEEIFAGFEDVDPRSVLGSGDVKYHMGATGEYTTRSGGNVHIHLVSNPSHLEAVDPVTVGRTRAKQDRTGQGGREKYLPLLVHGDAAFAGQGILAETMNYADLPGYTVGGTIHVVVNNLLGFTTSYTEEHSTRFAACIARRQSIPIFHVNGEDVDAVVRVARMATEYRYKFSTDVVIDLIGYRRHGHSEVDDPTITQPLLYKRIKEHPPLWEIYADDIGATAAQAQAAAVKAEFEAAQKKATGIKHKPLMRELPKYWDNYFGGLHRDEYEVETGLSSRELSELTDRLTTYPGNFHIHPKVKKLLEQRAEMGAGKRPVDYGMAEALAFASLVKAGTHVRFSGQDSRRGTFNQRHSVLIDIENENEYVPLENIAPGQARCEICNSTLSEAGVLGFEYGYSRDYPESLVLWEAQFGDFANVAQAIIDQFVAAGEAKWNLLSGLVMLLPHGYEGQGPEHSSARIERFIQLAAKHNLQIAQPSNAAQYFHLLRRQALRHWRKPLIVFTPKSMLRHPDASSPIADFTHKNFLNVIPDTEVGEADRILICTGKIGHELQAERKKRKDTSTAIVFLEQLYPFPEQEVIAEFDRHGRHADIVWVQEEPANMGAMFNMLPRLKRIAGERSVLTVKRSSSPSPATGSAKAHEVEQKTLLTLAFTTK
ncbi:2-oxoglutarate dehydrogenase E1 component [Candidatus Sulfotelmatobacter kueseliae]|uniref:oxoglutarate dehydrogenase (succinyl-transferring) n=1 Tax=Candidatus Sulfotelmatobacter kueseliae TaxID=2042962 RepID=A0A2U3KF57_9BACT|nr:2-oxoglutarate dehydrogenase E1 component [Candidatus Sulfotelmatobacter kueseliae]